MTFTCTKVFRDIPFAHRQPWHDGHCRWVHGHNWNITLTFAGSALDRNGFVIDFGKLDIIKQWIAQNLDHALLICNDDPNFEVFEKGNGSLWKMTVVPEGSTERLAAHFLEQCDQLIYDLTKGAVRVVECVLEESSCNSATARAKKK